MWFYKDKKPDFPADNKGLKMRASGRNIDIVKKLEAVPVAMPSGEAYEALQRGTIDCAASMTMDSAYTMKMHEVAKYVMFPEFGGYNIDTTAVFNIDSWNKLPKDVQDLIWKMGVELADKNRDLIMNVEQKQAKEMVAKGLVLYKLSPEAKKQWQALIVPSAWNDYITSLEKKGITNAREAFNKYTEAAKKYEKDIKWVDPF
jgi:TRAP-type C4-dicarboxylate transport system substrate-binding protein